MDAHPERCYEVNMTWEYIAGFVDGEGSIVKKGLVYNLSVSQGSREVLEEIRKFTGVGHVYSFGKRKANWKDESVYSAGGGRGTYYVLSNIVAHLIVKRAWALQVLSALKVRFQEIDQEKGLKIRRMQQARLLRQQGWTYREIANVLGTDFGYVRRLVLFSD